MFLPDPEKIGIHSQIEHIHYSIYKQRLLMEKFLQLYTLRDEKLFFLLHQSFINLHQRSILQTYNNLSILDMDQFNSTFGFIKVAEFGIDDPGFVFNKVDVGLRVTDKEYLVVLKVVKGKRGWVLDFNTVSF